MMMVEQEQAIFENAGQAVHVAFLVMAQEAMQDAPFRKALIRVMESINLDRGQTHWLDQLRGTKSGAINFEGLSGGEVRAQCALITQAVKTNLPPVERWVLQAKYGETDYEDVIGDGGAGESLSHSLALANAKAVAARAGVDVARKEFCAACDVPWSALTKAARPSQPAAFRAAREALAQANHAMAAAECEVQRVRVAVDRIRTVPEVDNGPVRKGHKEGVRRRYAFSAERIAAITGLSDYFQPMFPRLKPLAIDVMLGRMFANHKKLEISSRDLAAQFGGNHMGYLRASWKMKNQVREIEQHAIARLEPVFAAHGVIDGPCARDTL